MRRSLALLSSLAVGLAAISAVPTAAQAHWWWYGLGSGSGSSGSGSGSTNTSTTAPGFSRTYVSPGGDDANGCSVNDPCRTFQRAHDRTFMNGEINCTEAGGYGPVAITKSITIDCKEVPASINAGASNTSIGVSINITNSADTLKVVRLRGFTISGSGQSAATITATGTRIGLRGIYLQAASAVYIENLVISDFVQQAILDQRSGGTATQLFVIDTVLRNNGGTAIFVSSTAPGAFASLDNVRSEGNKYGVAVGPGNTANISRSLLSGNSAVGVEVDATGMAIVSNSVISRNTWGAENNSTLRLFNNDISFNTTAAFRANSSSSLGGNRVSGNANMGPPLVPVSPAAVDVIVP